MNDIMCNNLTNQRHGSALIMVISLLVLLTTIAITFLELVGRQYNSTIGVAAQVKAEIAVQQAQAHLIRCFNDSAAKPTRKTDDDPLNYTSLANQQWRREFEPVTDPDGNPFTDTVDFPNGDPMQGQALSVPASSTGMPSTTMVSSSPIVNSNTRLYDLIDADMLGTVDMFTLLFGHTKRFNGKNQYWSRWHNIEYLDAEFKTVEIDDSKTPVEKADIRRSSRYVLRYTAQALDLSGLHTINNNFPHELGTDSINRGSASTDSAHYIRYQNYLKTYGRSIKSMRAAVSGGKQYRASHSFDPLDDESVATNVEVGGDGLAKSAIKTGNQAMRDDWRLLVERAFRDGDLTWSTRYGGNFAPLSPGLKGRVQTWSHLRTVYKKGSIYANNFFLTPWGLGMLDETLYDGAAADADPVSTPWKINLLSAPNTNLRAAVFGLHSHLKTITTWHNSNYTMTKGNMESAANAHKARIHPSDLFGRDYPEAFPLALDSGRNVPVSGIGANASRPIGTETYWYGNGQVKRHSLNPNLYHKEFPTIGTRLSYVHDIMVALHSAIDDARVLWDEEKNLITGDEENAGPWGAWRYRGGKNNSHIKPVSASTSEDEMMQMIIREVYRILGEGEISGSNPAVSQGSYSRDAVYDPNGRTLLAGGGTFVGRGSFGSGSGDWEIYSELEPGANTRAMEYVLNDFMISLFGKANPDYVVGSKDYANIAVDFNGDGHAESTVSGWWDYNNNQRVWSWWWDGLGPYVRLASDGSEDYMKKAGWYRFEGGKVKRKLSGDRWEEITSTGNFFDWNNIWLTGNTTYPIKPFAKTGRFYIGKSTLMNGFIRGEVYDIMNKRPLAVADRYFVYRIDPNNDGDFSDNHVIIQTDDRIEASKFKQ